MSHRWIGVALLALVALVGCASPNSHILEGGSQVELRSYQSRSFDTADKVLVVRNVISTMQDLSFVIDKADADLGTVTGTKLSGYEVRMTVTVRPKSETQVIVRANATYNMKAIEDPVVYQQFFAALEKSLFLTAQQIE